MRKFIWILFLCGCTFSIFGQQALELPKAEPGQKIINGGEYAFVYAENHEQALWVAYHLTSAETVADVERTNYFKADKRITTGSSSPDDYQNSGLDRGHLVPAADLSFSRQAMTSSFLMSNISPQQPGFNRGIWKKLETLVRAWAQEEGELWVVTAGVLTDDLPQIGTNQVSVPEYFYKAILDRENGSYRGIAFILPNRNSSQPLDSFAVTIDSLEAMTGIDFFHLLNDRVEDSIEATIQVTDWNWNARESDAGNSATKNAAVQCSGTTGEGTRCKRRTTNASGRCYQHQ